MPRSSPYQGDFSGGEISPLWFGRKDEDDYKKSLARSFNGFPTLQGGWTRRGGTYYAGVAKNNYPVRLFKFKINDFSAYVLEFGINYMRVYSNHTLQQFAGSPYELATPFDQFDLPYLRVCQYQNSLYIVTPNRQPYVLQNNGSATLWTLSTVSFSDGPYARTYIPGITGPILHAIDKASSTDTGIGPFNGTLINCFPIAVQAFGSDPTNTFAMITVAPLQMEYLQPGDTVFLQSMTGAAAPYNNVSWTVTPLSPTTFILNGTSYSGATIAPGGGAYDLSWIPRYMAVGPVSNFRFNLPGVIPGPTLFYNGPVNHLGLINGFMPCISVATNRTGLTTYSTIGSYSTPGWGGFSGFPPVTIYPSCITFHEGRMWFGSLNDTHIYGSYIGQFSKMSPTDFATNSVVDNTVVSDVCAVALSFAAQESYGVYSLASDEKGLLVGTSGGPWLVRPSTLTEAITPTNISAKQITTTPTSFLTPAKVNKSLIFTELGNRRLREVAYYFDIDGFRAVDLSEKAEHLTAPGISTEVVYQNTPQQLLWVARSDGTLLSVTYDRTLDKLRAGFSEHYLGGISQPSGAPPVIESMCVIPGGYGQPEELWLSCERYINGTEFRSIEYMGKIFEDQDNLQDAHFVDYGTSINNLVWVQNMTNGATTSVQSAAHGLSVGDQVRFKFVYGMATPPVNKNPAITQGPTPSQINGKLYTVTAVADANHFSFNLDSTGLTPFAVTDQIILGTPTPSYFNKQVSQITGLTWLVGETVDILGDGAYLGSAVVNNSGVVTIPNGGVAGVIHVGLPMSSEVQLLRIEAGSADGTSFGKIRRINQLAMMVYRSAVFEFGSNFNQMYETTERQVSGGVNEATPLFSGMFSQEGIDFDYDTENQICLRQKRPLPFTLIGIAPQQIVQDKT